MASRSRPPAPANKMFLFDMRESVPEEYESKLIRIMSLRATKRSEAISRYLGKSYRLALSIYVEIALSAFDALRLNPPRNDIFTEGGDH
jgi:hypothetical protein